MDILEQAHKDGVVVGLSEVSGVKPRLDIDVMLMTQPTTFNLFIMALLEFKGDNVPWPVDPDYKFDRDDKMFYPAVAGIHGAPARAWDGEDSSTGEPGGYCAHNTPTFGLWHRPYLSMIEQSLYRQINNIAQRFTRSTVLSDEEKQEIVQAATEFRLPYWDYFRPRGYQTKFAGVFPGNRTTAPYDYPLPMVFSVPQLAVKTLPDGKLTLVDNPFMKYTFDPSDLDDSDWDGSNLDLSIPEIKDHTLRYKSNDTESVKLMNRTLNKIREDNMRIILCMIERGEYSNFNAFSTTGATVAGLKGPTGSIEALHGQYHLYVGGIVQSTGVGHGHMSQVPVAAFDPVFWMHHAQIDRIFAIWQACNPKSWFDQLTSPSRRALANQSSLPFRKPPLTTDPTDRYWNPNRSRGLAEFGYELEDISKYNTTDEIQDAFAAKYGWSRRLLPNQQFGDPSSDMLPLDLSKAQCFQPISVQGPGIPLNRNLVAKTLSQAQVVLSSIVSPKESAKVSYEWYVDDIVERMAMNGAFTIFYFVGDVTGASAADWLQLPSFAGVTHIFASPRELCDNCGRQEEQAELVTDTTPITSLLLDYVQIGQLNSMEANDVRPFLVKNLKWRVDTSNGTVIDPRALAQDYQLELSVSCKTAPLPGEQGQVTYQNYPEVITQIIGNASQAMTVQT